MKTNENLKQLALGICFVMLAGFFSGCAATASANDVSTEAGTAGSSGKKGRKAKKEEVYSPAGVWEYSIDSPGVDGRGIMRITGEPGNFEVVLQTEQFGELRVYDLDMSNRNMIGRIDLSGSTAGIEGDFDGDDFIGYLTLGDNAFPMEGIRTSK